MSRARTSTFSGNRDRCALGELALRLAFDGPASARFHGALNVKRNKKEEKKNYSTRSLSRGETEEQTE